MGDFNANAVAEEKERKINEILAAHPGPMPTMAIDNLTHMNGIDELFSDEDAGRLGQNMMESLMKYQPLMTRGKGTEFYYDTVNSPAPVMVNHGEPEKRIAAEILTDSLTLFDDLAGKYDPRTPAGRFAIHLSSPLSCLISIIAAS